MPDKYVYTVVGVGALIAIAIAVWFGVPEWQLYENPQSHTEAQPICASDTMKCDDGTIVHRVGPSCSFAPCSNETTTGEGKDTNKKDTAQPPSPSEKESVTTATVTTGIGQEINALDITLTPLSVTEDSRCPSGTECIWAGTVRVKTKVTSVRGTTTIDMQLNTPITTESETITLKDVSPSPVAKETIKTADYRFVFDISKK